MIPRLQRWQLLAFVLVAVLGIGIVGARYVHLDRMAGFGVYTVHARFADSGGIFTNAEVTYRGTPVGRVGPLRITDDGVEVDLQLDSGRAQVPDDAKAVVAERSAIGEQYVDLVPARSAGPYLRDGSIITRTAIQEPIQDFLKNVTLTSKSVDPAKLKTVVTELSTALGGNGENLRQLIDALGKLSQTGLDTIDETTSLIRNGSVALGTQAEQSSSVRAWASSLKVVAEQLQSSDPDIRRLLQTGNLSATELSALVRQSGGDVTKVVHDLALDLTTVAPVAKNLQQVFILLPLIAEGAFTTAPGDGLLHYGVVLEVNNPPNCTVGYESTQRMLDARKARDPAFDQTRDDFPFNTKVNCDVAQGNPTGVRSADRARYADPTVPQPWDGKTKKAPDHLDLSPIAQTVATLLGAHPK